MVGSHTAKARYRRRDTVVPNGDRLRRRFNELGLTQADFLIGRGFTLRTLQRAFAGERITRISLEQIAQALSLPYGEAALGSDARNRPNLITKRIHHPSAIAAESLEGDVFDEVSRELIRAANELRLEFQRTAEYKRPPLDIEDFAKARQLIDGMRKLDPNNGHAHYYAGEIKRWTCMQERSRDDFFRYLDFYESVFVAMQPQRTSLEKCYLSAHGYCEERTGWIHHLLALDLGSEGKAKKDVVVFEFTRWPATCIQ
jgi:transcriptional regulator with XRE-family HTH domain